MRFYPSCISIFIDVSLVQMIFIHPFLWDTVTQHDNCTTTISFTAAFCDVPWAHRCRSCGVDRTGDCLYFLSAGIISLIYMVLQISLRVLWLLGKCFTSWASSPVPKPSLYISKCLRKVITICICRCCKILHLPPMEFGESKCSHLVY